jgi:uncharacterized protein
VPFPGFAGASVARASGRAVSAPRSGGRPEAGGDESLKGRTVRLPIKVVPSSSRDGIAGWLGETLKVRVSAPAERGRANAAAESIVAEALGLPGESARIVAGRTSARKVIEIVGLPESEIERRLSKPLR